MAVAVVYLSDQQVACMYHTDVSLDTIARAEWRQGGHELQDLPWSVGYPCLRSAAHTLAPALATTGKSHSKNNNVCNTLLNLDDTLGSPPRHSLAPHLHSVVQRTQRIIQGRIAGRICCCLRSFTRGALAALSAFFQNDQVLRFSWLSNSPQCVLGFTQELCTDQAKPCCHIGCRCALSLGFAGLRSLPSAVPTVELTALQLLSFFCRCHIKLATVVRLIHAGAQDESHVAMMWDGTLTRRFFHHA